MRKETANITETQPAKGQGLLLRVAEALSKDVGRGLVRLDPQDLERRGGESGDVVVLDGRGSAIRTGRINGAPTCIASFEEATAGAGVLLASAKGEVVLLKVGK